MDVFFVVGGGFVIDIVKLMNFYFFYFEVNFMDFVNVLFGFGCLIDCKLKFLIVILIMVGIGFEIIGIVIFDFVFCKVKIGIVYRNFKFMFGICDFFNMVIMFLVVKVVFGLDVLCYFLELWIVIFYYECIFCFINFILWLVY